MDEQRFEREYRGVMAEIVLEDRGSAGWAGFVILHALSGLIVPVGSEFTASTRESAIAEAEEILRSTVDKLLDT